MEVNCPRCDSPIASEDVNVKRDVAYCARCKEASTLSDLVAGASAATIDPNDPPKGTWFSEDYDGFEVGVSTRSWGAWFVLPFTIAWGGLSVGGIYGSQFIRGDFNLSHTLIGIPFLIVSVLLICVTMMMLIGCVRISVREDDGEVFTGVMPIGRRRRFRWSEVTRISERRSPDNNNQMQSIILEGKTRLMIPAQANDPRRDFVIAVLRQKLRQRDRR